MKNILKSEHWNGVYNGIFFEIIKRDNYGDEIWNKLNESGPRSFSLPRFTWNTYVYMSENNFEKLKDKVNNAPWNGGQTYFKKIQEIYVSPPYGNDIKPDWILRSEKPFYKIGDDFMHSWDMDQQDRYDYDYMLHHIKGVIDFLIEGADANAKTNT